MKIMGWVNFKIKNEETQEIDETDPLTVKWRYIVMGCMALFILPVNCTKNLATLRYISMAILLIVLYTITVAFVETPEYYSHNRDLPDYTFHWWVAPYKIKWFQGWATMMLSYNC